MGLLPTFHKLSLANPSCHIAYPRSFLATRPCPNCFLPWIVLPSRPVLDSYSSFVQYPSSSPLSTLALPALECCPALSLHASEDRLHAQVAEHPSPAPETLQSSPSKYLSCSVKDAPLFQPVSQPRPGCQSLGHAPRRSQQVALRSRRSNASGPLPLARLLLAPPASPPLPPTPTCQDRAGGSPAPAQHSTAQHSTARQGPLQGVLVHSGSAPVLRWGHVPDTPQHLSLDSPLGADLGATATHLTGAAPQATRTSPASGRRETSGPASIPAEGT